MRLVVGSGFAHVGRNQGESDVGPRRKIIHSVKQRDAPTHLRPSAYLNIVPILPSEFATAAFQPLNRPGQGLFASGNDIAIDFNNPRFSDTGSIARFEPAGKPSAMSFSIGSGETLALDGLHRISHDVRQDLGDAGMAGLFRRGHRQALSMPMSLGQRALPARRRDARLAKAA